MQISVIIPTLNAERYLPALLDRLHRQTVKAHEIIVVDSDSGDRTVAIARENGAKVLQIPKERFDHGGTRNMAASKASGDVLVFLTQDALPEDDRLLEALTRPLAEHPEVSSVCGRQVARPGAAVLERMTAELNYPPEPQHKSLKDLDRLGIKLFFFTNVCAAYRREAFEAIGRFPEPIILNEDMVITARFILNGYTVVYQSEARVIHSHHYTLRQQFRRNFDIGASLRIHNWILKHAKAEGQGVKLVKKQMQQLLQSGDWRSVPRLVLEAAAKYSGYRLGLSYPAIPMFIRKKLSMYSFYWNREEHERASYSVPLNHDER
ncbi:glycosyltransferase family 2 protein [Cohnella algarum]|uniref:glycosyltransferase family 2 protein n=1 Tax=Cohnella algarum TaxID=2044859 RepID=UPI001967F217|nr:glycosyltransferase family A protein [Cohnella algarum]MBN2980684.1 glycosyltransferase family 2 protein [Cohnella algarum]